MSLPKISIVTPSFNQGGYLEQTIRSVLDQGYPNLEYVVIDGGSTDDSVDVIRRYEKHLKFWVSEKDRGQTDALNKGIKHCTGDVFGFINSDDLLYPRSLERVAQTWDQGVKWMVGWSQYLEPQGSDWPYLMRAVASPTDWFIYNPIPQQSSFFARSLLEEHGGFREDLHYSFDYEYWMRLRFKAGLKPFGIRQCMSAFRLHGQSKTMTVWAKFEAEDRRVWAEYEPYLSRRDRARLWGLRRAEQARLAQLAMWKAIGQKDAPAARRAGLRAVGKQPLSSDAWKGLYFALRGG